MDFYMFKLVAIGVIAFSISTYFPSAHAIENNNHSEKGNEFYLHDGVFMVLAEQHGMNTTHLNKDASRAEVEASEEFKTGLEICRKKAYEEQNTFYKGILASYYYFSLNSTKIGLKLAQEAAEQGDICGIEILRFAYGTGKGVLIDEAESGKWLIILSLLGEENGVEFVNLMHELDAKDKETKLENGPAETLKTFKAGEERAKNWVSKHKNLFFQEK